MDWAISQLHFLFSSNRILTLVNKRVNSHQHVLTIVFDGLQSTARCHGKLKENERPVCDLRSMGKTHQKPSSNQLQRR